MRFLMRSLAVASRHLHSDRCDVLVQKSRELSLFKGENAWVGRGLRILVIHLN